MSIKQPSPMHARSAGSFAVSSGATSRRTPTVGPALPPGADPDTISDEILTLLDQHRDKTARQMASLAIDRFPEHSRVRKIWGLFDNRGKASVRRGNEPATDEELAWLADPPEWARGKWVALVGNEAVAAADTLAEVLESLRTKDLAKRPLVHRIA